MKDDRVEEGVRDSGHKEKEKGRLMFPDVDSPNWGKYHNMDIDLALIKMRPLIPSFQNLCRIPNWLEGVEGDEEFEFHYISKCDVDENEGDDNKKLRTIDIHGNSSLENFIDSVMDTDDEEKFPSKVQKRGMGFSVGPQLGLGGLEVAHSIVRPVGDWDRAGIKPNPIPALDRS